MGSTGTAYSFTMAHSNLCEDSRLPVQTATRSVQRSSLRQRHRKVLSSRSFVVRLAMTSTGHRAAAAVACGLLVSSVAIDYGNRASPLAALGIGRSRSYRCTSPTALVSCATRATSYLNSEPQHWRLTWRRS